MWSRTFRSGGLEGMREGVGGVGSRLAGLLRGLSSGFAWLYLLESQRHWKLL